MGLNLNWAHVGNPLRHREAMETALREPSGTGGNVVVETRQVSASASLVAAPSADATRGSRDGTPVAQPRAADIASDTNATPPSAPSHTPPMERSAQSLIPDLQMPAFLTPYSGSLTAGNLLGNLELRLGDFDLQINALMSGITGRTTASGALSQRMQHLQALITAMSSNGKDGSETIKLENLTVNTAEGSMNALDYIRKYGLEEDLNRHGLTPDSKISGTQVQSAFDELRLAQGTLNGRTEMEMISLQELTNKRSQAVELTSKLMEAMNQSIRTILGNLGR